MYSSMWCERIQHWFEEETRRERPTFGRVIRAGLSRRQKGKSEVGKRAGESLRREETTWPVGIECGHVFQCGRLWKAAVSAEAAGRSVRATGTRVFAFRRRGQSTWICRWERPCGETLTNAAREGGFQRGGGALQMVRLDRIWVVAKGQDLRGGGRPLGRMGAVQLWSKEGGVVCVQSYLCPAEYERRSSAVREKKINTKSQGASLTTNDVLYLIILVWPPPWTW